VLIGDKHNIKGKKQKNGGKKIGICTRNQNKNRKTKKNRKT